jgi:hypothetical protein
MRELELTDGDLLPSCVVPFDQKVRPPHGDAARGPEYLRHEG